MGRLLNCRTFLRHNVCLFQIDHCLGTRDVRSANDFVFFFVQAKRDFCHEKVIKSHDLQKPFFPCKKAIKGPTKGGIS